MNRLERYRKYTANMTPGTGRILAEDFYVPPPGHSVSNDIALRLELEPNSTHVLVGGIGSGKTTQIVQMIKRLQGSFKQVGDKIIYCDVSQLHNLEADLKGVLVAIVGKRLVSELKRKIGGPIPEDLKEHVNELIRHADGFREWVEDYDGPYYDGEYDGPDDAHERGGYYHTVAGTLASPEKELSYQLRKLIAPIRAVKEALLGLTGNMIFAFDSLDRLRTTKRFELAVEDDVRVLKKCGIGVVVVAPMRFAVDRRGIEVFDNQHFNVAYNAEDRKELGFLRNVLRARADSKILSEKLAAKIARFSGGILRDLLQLAKSAGEVAYVASHNAVQPADAQHAIEDFGRALAIGLDESRIKKLETLYKTGKFIVSDDTDIELIDTRRIVLLRVNDWRVHPAIVPYLSIGSPVKVRR